MDYINPLAYPPSEEQLDTLQAALDPAIPVLIVDSVSGSGKTSTCELIAANLRKPSLYVTFSKALATEAYERIASKAPWVKVMTVHALAFHSHGKPYVHKLNRPSGYYLNCNGTGTEIAQSFKIKKFEVGAKAKVAPSAIGFLVKQTLAVYEASADEELGMEHIPESYLDAILAPAKKKEPNSVIFEHAVKELKKLVLEVSQKLWAKRIDINSPTLITHDTYVKLWTLSNPVISQDVLYLDESQDSSACMVKAFSNQHHAKVILVGDKDQNIYGWRYSVNAMAMMEGVNKVLSTSYRFGPNLAKLASKILNGRELKGFDKLNTEVLGPENRLFHKQGDLTSYTKLFRTNSALFVEAMNLIEAGHNIAIEADVKDFQMELSSAEALYKGNLGKVKHQDIVPYSVWWDYKAEAEINPRMKMVARIVESKKVQHYVAKFSNWENPVNPDITLCTAHKSKGREWDTVILANDYPPIVVESESGEKVLQIPPSEEVRLVYVAVTRAKKLLVYNEFVRDLLDNLDVIYEHYKANKSEQEESEL